MGASYQHNIAHNESMLTALDLQISRVQLVIESRTAKGLDATAAGQLLRRLHGSRDLHDGLHSHLIASEWCLGSTGDFAGWK